jgi:hypothetical protein
MAWYFVKHTQLYVYLYRTDTYLNVTDLNSVLHYLLTGITSLLLKSYEGFYCNVNITWNMEQYATKLEIHTSNTMDSFTMEAIFCRLVSYTPVFPRLCSAQRKDGFRKKAPWQKNVSFNIRVIIFTKFIQNYFNWSIL